jgi:hypothetical protein
MIKLVTKLRNPQHSVLILWMLALAYVTGIGWSGFQLSTPLFQNDPRPLRFLLLFACLAVTHIWGAFCVARRKNNAVLLIPGSQDG